MSRVRQEIKHRLIQSGPARFKTLLNTNIALLVTLVVLIFLMPVIPFEVYHIVRVLLCLAVVSGLFAADFSKPVFKILLFFATGVISLTVLSLLLDQSASLTYISFALNTVFFVLITLALITHVARSRDVNSSTLLCAVNSYLLIGLTLSMLFIILDLIAPGSFNIVSTEDQRFSTFLYYGFVTLSTLGYGDIVPLTPAARSLAAFTAVFGQLYLVVIMAFLIGKYLNTKNQDS